MNVWIIYTFCPPPIIAWYYNPDYFCLTITNILLNAMNTSTFAKTIVSHWSVIAVVAVLIYYSIFSHEFQLYWDDQWQVINSMTNDGISLKNLQTIFHSISNGQYSPINQLYYTLIHLCFGYSSLAFHIGNLLFHIFNYCCPLKLKRA